MERVGTRAQVMHGNAKQTAGGLKKKDLKYNKQGKIVSKKMSQRAKKENRLQKAGYTTKKGQFGAFKMIGGNGNNNSNNRATTNSKPHVLANNVKYRNMKFRQDFEKIDLPLELPTKKHKGIYYGDMFPVEQITSITCIETGNTWQIKLSMPFNNSTEFLFNYSEHLTPPRSTGAFGYVTIMQNNDYEYIIAVKTSKTNTNSNKLVNNNNNYAKNKVITKHVFIPYKFINHKLIMSFGYTISSLKKKKRSFVFSDKKIFTYDKYILPIVNLIAIKLIEYIKLLYNNGLFYTDIKPDNIIITFLTKNTCKLSLIDLGSITTRKSTQIIRNRRMGEPPYYNDETFLGQKKLTVAWNLVKTIEKISNLKLTYIYMDRFKETKYDLDLDDTVNKYFNELINVLTYLAYIRI